MKLIYELESKMNQNRSLIFSDVKENELNSIAIFLNTLKTVENKKFNITFENCKDYEKLQNLIKSGSILPYHNSEKVFVPQKKNKEINWKDFGERVVLKDKNGNEDIMFKIPKIRCEDLFPDGELGYGTYPAFQIRDKNGKLIEEKDYIYISCYMASKVDEYANILLTTTSAKIRCNDENSDNSLITNVSFDKARELSESKGEGYHLMTIWEWALCAFLSYKACPNSYNIKEKIHSHNGKYNGIFDLFGININWHWIDGFKQEKDDCWYINESNNYKIKEKNWRNLGKRPNWFQDCEYFSGLKTKDFLNSKNKNILLFVRALLINYPIEDLAGDVWYNTGERMPIRGGYWYDGACAGLAALALDDGRSYSDTNIGFRFAFL